MQIDDEILDPWFIENLVCPLDKSKLVYQNKSLVCIKKKHNYHIFNSIPIMLINEYVPTKNNFSKHSLDIVYKKTEIKNKYRNELAKNEIDSHVQRVIAGTNSNFYKNLIGKLKRYPIPIFPKINSDGNQLLDIGCGWGRWTISSHKSGFNSIGIDPSLESILAAKRVSKQLDIKSRYLVGDACYLPFHENLFDYCYSYSVLQHFSKFDTEMALKEIKYVLKPNGISQIQMLNKFGLRGLYVQFKKIFKGAKYFDATYWSSKELIETFEKNIGISKIELGSFFTQAQNTDYDLFSLDKKLICKFSQFLYKLTSIIPYLKRFGDNLFLISKK